MDDLLNNLDLLGFAIAPDFLNSEEIDSLISALAAVEASDAVRKREGVYAIRNLLEVVPAIARLANLDKLASLVRSALGKDAFPVRGTLFDKTPAANWLVPWHQDLTICVKQRLDVAGFGPWTTKARVPHVQPPKAILDAMLAPCAYCLQPIALAGLPPSKPISLGETVHRRLAPSDAEVSF
jgi:hypothetical protein